jgi:tetratricopeptide (TPR) repeat protein
MKKTIILLALVFISTISFAQKGKVTSAETLKDAGKLDEAFKVINTATDPNNPDAEKSVPWPRAWEVKGEIFQAIYKSANENFKKLEADPLTKAFECYKKALELDTDGKASKSIKIKLALLSQADLTDQAISAYNKNDFKKSLQSFEQILEINNMPLMKADNPNDIDTAVIFNAGLTAYNAQEYDKAIKYYSEAAKYGYNGGKTVKEIANAYELKGDTAMALKTLQDGFQKYPSEIGLVEKMINIYVATDKTADALSYLELAIKQNPTNSTYFSVQGKLFDNLGRTDDAKKSYVKAIEVDGNNFIANYNLGALYYNEGVKQWNVALAIPTNQTAKFEEEVAKCDVWWAKALPFMEKCMQIDPKEIATMETLKNLYYRMMAKDKATWEPKYTEMDAKIKALK